MGVGITKWLGSSGDSQKHLPGCRETRTAHRRHIPRGETDWLQDAYYLAAGVQSNAAYLQEIKQTKDAWERQLREVLDQQFPAEAMSQGRLIEIFNEEAQPGDTVVSTAGTPVGEIHQIWNVSRSASCHLEFGFSCMGYDTPAAIGVRMAQPEGEVYVFLGDGNFLMNPTELVTALQENLNITLVLSENHGFQSIHGHQRAHVGHSLGNEFRSKRTSSNRLDGDYVKIDLAKTAEGFGARTWRAVTPESFRTALRAARQETGPCAIVGADAPASRVGSLVGHRSGGSDQRSRHPKAACGV